MTLARALTLLALVAALTVGAGAPRRAEAGGRIVVGVGPIYPYAYSYPFYAPPPVYYPYAVAPPWVAAPGVPPPGWVPGRWERHYDQTGSPYDVWVPPHLR